MESIKRLIGGIKEPDLKLKEQAQQHLDSLTKPQGSLGRLEELARQVAAISGKTSPQLKTRVVFTLCADHGIAREGVSAYPQEVTAQMVQNFVSGGAAINVLARQINARVVVADFGVAADTIPDPHVHDLKIGLGTANMTQGPAMTREEAILAIKRGIELFQQEQHPQRIDIVGTGDMGIGNTTAASAITACISRTPVDRVTGLGTGISPQTRKHKSALISQALALNQPDPRDPIDVLAKVGGYEIGGLSGVILAAAANKVPVVLDGFISGAAALIALSLQPRLKEYLIASHMSAETGHQVVLDHLGLKPLLDLNLRLGEGTGAVLGIHIVDAAVRILSQMATFAEAGVSQID